VIHDFLSFYIDVTKCETEEWKEKTFLWSAPASSEISDLQNFWLHTMYACTESYYTYQIRWQNWLLGLRNSCLRKCVGL